MDPKPAEQADRLPDRSPDRPRRLLSSRLPDRPPDRPRRLLPDRLPDPLRRLLPDRLRRSLPLLGALLVAAVTILAVGWRSAPEPYQEASFLLDTPIRFQAYGNGAREAVAAARAELARAESLLNRYDQTSEVGRINAHPMEWQTLDPLTARALAAGRRFGQESGGAFDVTLGGVLDLYHFGGDGRVPGAGELSAALQHTGPAAWELDEAGGRARLLDPAAQIDLGGLQKGLATDLAAEALIRRGITSALVDAGSNMVAVGCRADGRPWRIGISDPRQPGAVLAVIELADQAISTSGDYQQYFMRDGVRYHHILDPATGRPASGTAAVTVLAPTGLEADMLSTALFVMGPEAGLRWLKANPGREALFVSVDGQLQMSPGMERLVEIVASQSREESR